MKEDANARLKRLTMRSWRRGMKEMDLILGPYADARLADMPQLTGPITTACCLRTIRIFTSG